MAQSVISVRREVKQTGRQIAASRKGDDADCAGAPKLSAGDETGDSIGGCVKAAREADCTVDERR